MEDGVTLFRGINDGECAADRVPGMASGRGVAGVDGVRGIGGGSCIIDILFILRVSVGLVVRAPRPEALWPGICESRLLPEDDGVLDLRAGDLPGERPVPMNDDRERA